MPRHLPTILGFLALIGAACSPSDAPGSGGTQTFRAISVDSADFWDRQTTTNAELLKELVDEFNANRESPLPLKLVHTGSYTDIYRKVTASIRAKTLPAMAVSYSNMTVVYARSGAVASIDALIEHPEHGLSQNELDDFFPAALDSNRYPSLGGGMYSFPFTKSVLVLFYNKRVLAEAGLTSPPRTWDEFLAQCRQIKSRTGKFAIAIDVDCSTVDGMIFSMGGEVIQGIETQFDSPESIAVFELLETLMREELAYQNPPRTYNDETAFTQDKIAFMLRTSSQTPYLRELMEDTSAWGIARVPQADPDNPHTALYGGEITIFNTTEEQRRTAWDFVRFFTSPDVTVRWALGTGYLPLRRSAVEDPRMQAYWNQWPDGRTAFDCLDFAKSEPNVPGWQEVRAIVEKAETAVITGVQSGREAALEAKKLADAVLAKR